MPEPRITLKEARLELGLTVEEAALAAGYKSKSGWAMVELGVNTPDLQQMQRMAEVVQKPPYVVFPELRPLLQTPSEGDVARG